MHRSRFPSSPTRPGRRPPLRVPLTLLVCSLGIQIAAAAPAAQAFPRTELRQTSGLHALHFLLEEGVIEVLVPEDLVVGEAVSGSVLVQPRGAPGKQRAKNERKLAKLQVRVGGLTRPAEDALFGPVAVCARPSGSDLPTVRCQGGPEDPGAGAPSLEVRLENRKGRAVAQTRLPVLSRAPPGSADFTYLPVAKAGQPLEILGPFDGDFSTTRVLVHDRRATPVAESPRRTVVRSPGSVVGETRLRLDRGDRSLTGPLRNLLVLLRFTKPALQAGERTILEVQVHGLEGLAEPLPLELASLTPESARFERGPLRPLVIHPREVQGGGVYPWVGTLVGVQPGSISLELRTEGARPRRGLEASRR